MNTSVSLIEASVTFLGYKSPQGKVALPADCPIAKAYPVCVESRPRGRFARV